MNREQFEKFLAELTKELVKYWKSEKITEEQAKFLYNSKLQSMLEQVVYDVGKILPDYSFFFNSYWRKIKYTPRGTLRKRISTSRCIQFCAEILSYLEEERGAKEKIEDGKIFESAKDKLKAAEKAFRKDDWTSAMNNLNSSVELALKDKLAIPATLSKIKTNKVIEVLVKHGIGPTQHLKEVQKHIFIDNKVKHLGYKPNKPDCVTAMKSVEDLLNMLDKVEMKIKEDVMKKIYGSV